MAMALARSDVSARVPLLGELSRFSAVALRAVSCSPALALSLG